MSEHSCTVLTEGCYRCDLNRDEMDRDRLDHLRVAKLLRKVAGNGKRRPGTRGLLLDLADEVEEHAQEVQAALSRPNTRSVALGDSEDLEAPQNGGKTLAGSLGEIFERLGLLEYKTRRICHCGIPVAWGYDGNPEHHRGMCIRCESVRCDAYPGACEVRS